MMEENQVPNRFAPFICFASLLLIAVMTISCGSSSSATKPTCTGGPYDVAGVWSADLYISGVYPVKAGVISQSGLALFFDNAGDENIMTGITGACSFSDNLILDIGLVNFGVGGNSYSFPVQGNVQPGPVITGTVSDPSGPQSFVYTPFQPFTPTALNSSMSVVDESSPIACLTTYCVQVQVVPSGTGNSADMTLSGTDGFNCYVSGTFTQEGSNAANLNVFDVSLTFTGTGCQVAGTITGLGFESPADYFSFSDYPSGTFLYAMSANSANVFEFCPTGCAL
jgi:hypothetical protein